VYLIVEVEDFVVFDNIEVEDSFAEVLFAVETSVLGSFSCSTVVIVFGMHVKPGINKLSLLKPIISIDSSAPSGQGGRVVEILD